MCGIVGWLNFGRDLRAERTVMHRMTATMARRGPDDEGLWTGVHAALGHRRLAVIDLELGRQPMLGRRHPAGGPVVLSYSGEIYNFLDLRAELTSLGHRFHTRSDTEVLLRAYLEWGTDCLGRLNGMYAFAVWDADHEELLLARDRLGIKPLYVHTFPDGLLFASEPKGILANPLFTARLDERMLPALLNPRLALPGETPLVGLREVRPGHVLCAGRNGVREYPYWRLVSRPHTDDLATTVATVRELLTDVVARQLVADVPVCGLLSGGLDSSAVAALAPVPLRTYSVDFVDAERDFRPTPLRPDRDAPYARAAAAFLGTDHTEVTLDAEAVLAGRTAAMRARDLPSLGQFDSSMHALFDAIRRDATVALSGEAADEIFGGYPWFHDPTLVHRNTFPWLGHGARAADCLAPDVLDRICPEDQERETYATLLARVPRLDGERGLQARMREVLYLSMQGPLALLLDRKDRMSMAVGLEVRVPFCDHRLVEYLWNVPWQMKVADGREKSLLRLAVADLLPHGVRYRRKSAYPATFDPAYARAVLDGVRRLTRDPDSPLRELLDADRVHKLAEGVEVSVAWADTAHVLSPLLEADAWMRAYAVTLA